MERGGKHHGQLASDDTIKKHIATWRQGRELGGRKGGCVWLRACGERPLVSRDARSAGANRTGQPRHQAQIYTFII